MATSDQKSLLTSDAIRNVSGLLFFSAPVFRLAVSKNITPTVGSASLIFSPTSRTEATISAVSYSFLKAMLALTKICFGARCVVSSPKYFNNIRMRLHGAADGLDLVDNRRLARKADRAKIKTTIARMMPMMIEAIPSRYCPLPGGNKRPEKTLPALAERMFFGGRAFVKPKPEQSRKAWWVVSASE